MNKDKIKRVLMSLKNTENEIVVSRLLTELEWLTNEELSHKFFFLGKSEILIKKYFQMIIDMELDKECIDEIKNKIFSPLKKIDNNLFTYEIDGNSILLHMTVDLYDLIYDYGVSITKRVLNLQLLVAIDKLIDKMEQGDEELKEIKNIYMLSPLLYGKNELDFLEKLGFKIKRFKRRDLKNQKIINRDIDARRAFDSWGAINNVGMAQIEIDEIKLPQYQKEKERIIKENEEMQIPLYEVEELVQIIKRKNKTYTNFGTTNKYGNSYEEHDSEFLEI